MNKIRREPEAYIQSLEMDSDLRILFVEGNEDRMLLEHICSDEIDENTIVIEIDSVKLPKEIEGGNRGKVIYCALLSKQKHQRLKYFVDKDYSTFTGEKIPKNVTITDFRDIESYLYEKDSIDKYLKIGVKTDKINSTHLLKQMYKAKYFGFIRIASLKNNLKLSVNKTNIKLSKYIKTETDYTVTIDEDKYLKSLIQNTKDKISLEQLKKYIDGVIAKYSKENTKNILHGKDAIEILKIISNKIKKNDNYESVFWMAFDKNKTNEFENLNSIVNYLKNLP